VVVSGVVVVVSGVVVVASGVVVPPSVCAAGSWAPDSASAIVGANNPNANAKHNNTEDNRLIRFISHFLLHKRTTYFRLTAPHNATSTPKEPTLFIQQTSCQTIHSPHKQLFSIKKTIIHCLVWKRNKHESVTSLSWWCTKRENVAILNGKAAGELQHK
jgi:hypothetical protein